MQTSIAGARRLNVRFSFLLGHMSVETTERHLGSKQRFRNAVNDCIGTGPD
jgi:hypothetical protein